MLIYIFSSGCRADLLAAVPVAEAPEAPADLVAEAPADVALKK